MFRLRMLFLVGLITGSVFGQTVYELNHMCVRNALQESDPTEQLGTHILAEFMGCKNLNAHEQLADILTQAAHDANATVLNVSTHKFSPMGMSGLVLLQESHISIHTWPEYGYAAIDIYTCGEHVSSQRAIDTLAAFFEPEHIQQIEVKRGFIKNATE